MSDATTGTITAGQTVRLPLAELPATVLPGTVVTLAIDSDALRRSVDAAREAAGNRLLLRAAGNELGVIAQVPDIGALPNGQPVAVIRVDQRARVTAVHAAERGATFADAELLTDPRPTPRVEALARELRATLEPIAQLRRSRRLPELLRSGPEPGALADAVVSWAELDEDRRRDTLAAVNVADRVELVLAWAKDHLAELQVAETIRNDVTEGVDKQQREYLLRQQLAAIRKELGEGDDDVVGEYRTKLESLDAPDSTKNFLAKELDRLERTGAQSPEHGWIRTWLDRAFELPWGVRSDDTLDLPEAQRILDEDHYGLADVKSRIVEFLAVRKLRGDRDVDEAEARATTRRGAGAIVTLVGPPGVGKTSLGESIARAMGRKFVRIALGGVRDEAEIRGHRRTYVGSQPGHIVRAITEAGTMNPVVLLDEVDKLGAGAWAGDPTAALLEVLDPAQNHTFRDHYLELDLDLSEVVFIATANLLDTVPAPLLDRMDIVRLDGYTDAEK
ncbi:MAG: AAA family ATPase, partial [Ilumatobacteraceae bacterium]